MLTSLSSDMGLEGGVDELLEVATAGTPVAAVAPAALSLLPPLPPLRRFLKMAALDCDRLRSEEGGTACSHEYNYYF